MGIETVLLVATLVVTAASTAYQVIQAKKMRQKALAAADARKGFELVAEGESGYAPICYGRVKVGGFRTFHATSSTFNYNGTNADKTFTTGYSGTGGYVYNYRIWGRVYNGYNYYSTQSDSATVSPTANGYMSQSLQGTRNEFLYFQQVLCAGPINSVRDVIIDQGRTINDSSLGSFGHIEKTPSEKSHDGVKAALRLDYHYAGSEADSVAIANFGNRESAIFDKLAYVNAVFRLDRDNPQFSGVPTVQSLIEGKLVRTVTAGVISSTVSYYDNPAGYIYSNNPAWCLLDYMLDPVSGKGLSLDEIDLDSFEATAAVCATVVQTGVTVGGNFWNPTDGVDVVTTRDLPLYECNIIIDPEKPFRDNIESILSTMGDARLIWSGGKYRLSLQYVATNDDLVLSGTITDDDIAHGSSVTLDWPNAENKLNYCTVKFHNEFENFVEDSQSWPPKYTQSYMIGIGSKRYGFGTGSWDDSKPGGRLLNGYAVWDMAHESTTLEYLFKVDKGLNGTYTLEHTGDDKSVLSLYNVTAGTTLITDSTETNWREITSHSVSLGSASEDTIYRITITGYNTGSGDKNYKGLAAKISNSSRVLWTTRDTTYDTFITVAHDSTVYNTMLAEDNNVLLEQTIFAEGITDPQHALAKAEELVRTSRSASKLRLELIIKDRIYEPGDYVKVESNHLNIGIIGSFYGRVESIKVKSEDRYDIELTRFDYSQLAWSVKDDVYIHVPNAYGWYLPQPYTIYYNPPDPISNFDSSGILTCDPVSIDSLAGYIWYMHRAGIDDVDANGKPLFYEIGRTKEPYFNIGRVEAASAFFGVKTFSSNGRMSLMTTTDPYDAIDLVHSWIKQVVITASASTFADNSEPILLTAEIYAIPNNTIRWLVDSIEQVGETTNQLYIPKFTDVRQRTVSVLVTDTDTQTVYEDIIDLGYIPPGSEGTYTDIRFVRSWSQPATPEGVEPLGWFNYAPAGDETLWMSSAIKSSTDNTLLTAWSTPARMTNMIFRGAYSATETYYQFNVVTFNGGLYICTYDGSIGNEPSGTAQPTPFWDVIIGTDGTPGGTPPDATIDVSGSSTGINLRSLADATGYTGSTDATYVFNINGDITGLAGDNMAGTGGIGIDTGTWPSGYTIDITINIISGVTVAGGGGGGAPSVGSYGTVGAAGGQGGHAIYCRLPVTITNEGAIKAGGGGGGAGGNARSDAYSTPTNKPGGPGGGGAPNGKAGALLATVGYPSGQANYTASAGSDGTTSGGGAGGIGRHRYDGWSTYGGNGGAGATYAGTGTTGETARSEGTDPVGGIGGGPGNAIKRNGYTVTYSGAGTLTGANS